MLRGATAVLALALSPAGPVRAQDAPGRPAPVSVAEVRELRAEQTLELSGSVLARRYARLSPRIPGLVLATPTDAGDRLAAGDLVLRLDPRLAELAVAEARAAVEAARVAHEEARRLAAEARRLARDQFVPETQIDAREAAVASAEAALAVARAALASAEERRARHTVVAPFEGVLAARLAEAGEWVETGTPVAELVALDALWLDVRVPQRYWPSLRSDARASVHIDGLPGELPATVHARVPVSDPGARTFLVRLTLDDPPPDVVPGMAATVRFTWAGERPVLSVPRDAIIRFPEGTTTVWTVVDAGAAGLVAREVEVTVTRYAGDEALLTSGVAAGERVVVRGNEVLTEGQAVRLSEVR